MREVVHVREEVDRGVLERPRENTILVMPERESLQGASGNIGRGGDWGRLDLGD